MMQRQSHSRLKCLCISKVLYADMYIQRVYCTSFPRFVVVVVVCSSSHATESRFQRDCAVVLRCIMHMRLGVVMIYLKNSPWSAYHNRLPVAMEVYNLGVNICYLILMWQSSCIKYTRHSTLNFSRRLSSNNLIIVKHKYENWIITRHWDIFNCIIQLCRFTGSPSSDNCMADFIMGR